MPKKLEKAIAKTREEAIALGLRHYFDGIPCRNGHIANRRIDPRTDMCLSCAIGYIDKWKSDHPEYVPKDNRKKSPIDHRRTATQAAQKVAKEQGVTRFFTGVPCRNGHVDFRWTANTKCASCEKDVRKKYNKKHEAKLRQQQIAYKLANVPPEKHARRVREWWINHPERVPERNARLKIYAKNRLENNPSYYRDYANAYYHANKHRPEYTLPINLRTRIRGAIKGLVKSGSAVNDLGCSIEELKIWLENKFVDDMTWETHGTTWSIDHAIPLSYFDLTDREQFLKAVHYTNLQPLTIADNSKKGGYRPNYRYKARMKKAA